MMLYLIRRPDIFGVAETVLVRPDPVEVAA